MLETVRNCYSGLKILEAAGICPQWPENSDFTGNLLETALQWSAFAGNCLKITGTLIPVIGSREN
ncbi:hypothetical protein KY290_010341 [Solanum tuberosum]|uniref:Uncharacterized protein n=1 Tax=Solanum tuberosum TaxID=4113 RepID=A0ABQ7VZN6_SOLTU|nr:hypothetical protein KY290_010341 [Solanum tuberosum]